MTLSPPLPRSKVRRPSIPVNPARCSLVPGACSISDWCYPADVFEWWGRKGRQRFQPDAPRPFDSRSFHSDRSVWVFERTDHPVMKLHSGHPCQVWIRVS